MQRLNLIHQWQWHNEVVTGPSILCTCMFAMLVAFFGWQSFCTRAWFLWPLGVGFLVELAALSLRTVSASDSLNLDLFVTSQCLLNLVPPFIALAFYLVSVRLLRFSFARDPLSPRLQKQCLAWCLAVLGLDFLSFVIQVGAISASGQIYRRSHNQLDLSKGVQCWGALVCGVMLQMTACVGFVFLCHRSVIGHDIYAVGKDWRATVAVMSAAEWFLMARTVYGVMESPLISWSPGQHEEWAFWVFDYLLILLSLLLFSIYHPGKYLSSSLRSIRGDISALQDEFLRRPPQVPAPATTSTPQ